MYVDKNYCKIGDHCHYTVNTEVIRMVNIIYYTMRLMKLQYLFTTNQISRIIKYLGKEFKFNGVKCLGENTVGGKLKQTSLSNKQNSFSSSKIEGANELDCKYAKRTRKIFNIKNLGDYHDLVV